MEAVAEKIGSFLSSTRSLIASGVGLSIVGFCAEDIYLSGYGINYADYASPADLTIDTLEALAMVLLLSALSAVLAIAVIYGWQLLRLVVNRLHIILAQLRNRSLRKSKLPEELPPSRYQVQAESVRILNFAVGFALVSAIIVAAGRYHASRSPMDDGARDPSSSKKLLDRSVRALGAPFRALGAIPAPTNVSLVGPTEAVRDFFCVWSDTPEATCTLAPLRLAGRNSSHYFLLASEEGRLRPVVLPTGSIVGLSMTTGFPDTRPSAPEPSLPNGPAPVPPAVGVSPDALAMIDAFAKIASELAIIARKTPDQPRPQSLVASGEIRLIAPTTHTLELDTRILEPVRGLIDYWTAVDNGKLDRLESRRARLESCLFYLNARRHLWSRVRGGLPEDDHQCLDFLSDPPTQSDGRQLSIVDDGSQ